MAGKRHSTIPVGPFSRDRRLVEATVDRRTKAALVAAKARGVKLGGKRPGVVMTPKIRASGQAARTARADAFARDLAPTVQALRANGVTSLRGLARALNEAKVPPPRRQGVWSDAQVKVLLERINKAS